MELDEMKIKWQELSNKLEQTQATNKWIIKDILNTRQQTMRDKLLKFEVVFLIFCVVFGIFTYTLFKAGVYPFRFSAVIGAVFVLAGIFQVYKVNMIRKISIEKCTTSELIRKTIKYKMVTQMRTVVGLILLIPIFIFLFYFDDTMTGAMKIGGCIGGVIGLMIGLALFFRKLKNINQLLKTYKDIEKTDANE